MSKFLCNKVLNKEIPQTKIEASPDKASFMIDGITEDKTKIDFSGTPSLVGAHDTPVTKAKLDLDNHNKIDKIDVQLPMQVLI